MGAGTKHSPGQHTFEHGLFANAKQPGNYSPDIFAKHDQPQHQSAGSDESKYERSGNFEPNRHRSPGLNLSEPRPAWCSNSR